MEIGRIFRKLLAGEGSQTGAPPPGAPKTGEGSAAPPEPDTTEGIQQVIDACLNECGGALRGYGYERPDFQALPSVPRLLDGTPAFQMRATPLVLERLARRAGISSHTPKYYAQQELLYYLVDRLLSRQHPYPAEVLARMLRCAADWTEQSHSYGGFPGQLPMARLLTLVEHQCEEQPPDIVVEQLQRLWPRCREASSDERKLQLRIERLCGVAPAVLPLAGEPWADALREDFQQMPAEARDRWAALLAHAQTALDSKPSGKWVKEARVRVTALPEGEFVQRVPRWFGRVREPRSAPPAGDTPYYGDLSQYLAEPNVILLRGLAWCCGAVEEPALARALGDLAESCFKKIPDVGARCERAGNACIHALGLMGDPEAVAQLTRLRARIGQGKVRTAVERALELAAARAGMTAADLEEMAVPTCGLNREGVLRREIGAYTAEIRVCGRDARLDWLNEAGKSLKSVPAAVRKEQPDELKSVQNTHRDLQKLVTAQCDRLERLLRTERSWSFAVWRERYLEHPLLAPLVRRLIWVFGRGDAAVLGMWRDGGLAGLDGDPLAGLDDETRVSLWHPLGYSPETVLAWRELLEREGIVQPFKQAHREVYLLTEAELVTGTYSNRFAAHVLRQHQFRALCGARGWGYQLQGNWDGGAHDYASLPLPEWNLRAEFWLDYVNDNQTSDMGVLLYIGTDQVRFNRNTGAAVPLTEVPALVFSEVMRDVDLFVGVASIAADPHWHDRGEERHVDYWHRQVFGELNGSAETRRDVLSRLVPRLKIRDRCTLEGRFLRVRGDLRSYKIHLGSGNILMEPNNQYLCIVPARGATLGGEVFLPFEGDGMLSLILSKAFLLAEDTRIKDRSIVSQISRGC